MDSAVTPDDEPDFYSRAFDLVAPADVMRAFDSLRLHAGKPIGRRRRRRHTFAGTQTFELEHRRLLARQRTIAVAGDVFGPYPGFGVGRRMERKLELVGGREHPGLSSEGELPLDVDPSRIGPRNKVPS